MKATRLEKFALAMKRCLLPLALFAVAVLPTAAHAQLTPFAVANEVLMFQQSQDLTYIASHFGTDPTASLNFTTHVDPAGQNFTFSLNPGSTYLGQPITLTTSGRLVQNAYWAVTMSGTFGGVPWSSSGQYVPPNSSSGRQQPCGLGGCGGISYNVVTSYKMLPSNCNPNDITCAVARECVAYDDAEGFDQTHCYDADSYGLPVNDGMDTYTGSSWPLFFGGWNWGCNDDLYSLSATGVTPTDGSNGHSSTGVSPLISTYLNFSSDIGTSFSAYDCCNGSPVSGAGSGTSVTAANPFVAGTTGSISRMDLGIGWVGGANSFYAALYTDNNGLPGTEIGRWDNLSSNLQFGQCCGTVPVTNITGVSLTAGQSYFVVLGPENVSDNSSLMWNRNTQGATGIGLYSNDGGQTWNSNGQQPLAAFNIVNRPQGIMVAANQFSAGASGSVSEIDLSVSYGSGANSFYAALYTSNSGQPGTQLARWDNLTSSQSFNNCCGVVSITGITGLSLTAGQSYFLVVGPENLNSNTVEQWNFNTTGATGLSLLSVDGGLTWNNQTQNALGGFDVLGGRGTMYSNFGAEGQTYDCCAALRISGGTIAASMIAGK